MLGRSLPLKKIQLWPKKVEYCIADKGAILTIAQRQNSVTYFVGFQVDTLRMKGHELNVESQLQNFREWDLSRFQPLIPGMDILAKIFRVKELPKVCFEGTYENGKEEAMKKRRKMLNDDPIRKEKKRLARYNELKAKMAELQRKKEEEKDRKRKREQVELEEEAAANAIKQEEADENAANDMTAEEEAPESNEESNLLESALDTIQETGEARKTREEAEADRRKLLAGELLDEVDEQGNESDDDEYGYNIDRNRHSILPTRAHADKRSLPMLEEDAEMLKKLGYHAVSDDEAKIIGANLIPPWGEQPKSPCR
jgi:flagellar biosynthesis GTPase FlhF